MNDRSSGAPGPDSPDSPAPSPKDPNQIYRRIFDAIVDHKLLPGTHLKEDELCELVGVGRSRLRTALAQGLQQGRHLLRWRAELGRQVLQGRIVVYCHAYENNRLAQVDF